jgi:hypothetical protein
MRGNARSSGEVGQIPHVLALSGSIHPRPDSHSITLMQRTLLQLVAFSGALLCMSAPLQIGGARSAAEYQPHCSVAKAAARRDRVESLPVSGTAEVAESLCVASARMAEHG